MEPDSKIEKGSKVVLANLSGDELVRLWKAGREQAADVLMDRYALRLVALVANRLNRRFRDTVDPVDIVQSAMGSFFHAASDSRVRVSGSASLWRLLATFSRRKLAREIERQSATKRGGDRRRVEFDHVEPVSRQIIDLNPDRENLGSALAWLEALLEGELPNDLHDLLHRLLAGDTQKDIAKALSIDERTVRRRIARLRDQITSPEVAREHSTSPSKLSLPQVHYREFVLGKLIGRGGFGKVYRASLQSDGSTVAVKFLRKSYWKNDDARQSFLNEIDAASRIDHPGVIRYLGWGESPHGGPYVISEWINGTQLSDLSKPSPEQFVEHLRQVCQALDAVHRAGVIHGDVTPHNLMVNLDSRIVITDFGFSQRENADHNPPVGGTLGFAAPEQLSPAFGEIGPHTDVYAVGGLAFQFLTGLPPHHAETVQASLADTISVDNVAIDPNPGASLAETTLYQIASAGLRKAVSNRPRHIADLIKIINRTSEPIQP